MEGYSMLSLSSLMSVKNMQWDYLGQKIDTLFAFMSLAITILFPPVILIFMITRFKDFEQKNMIAKFGSLYEDLDLKNKWTIIFRFWFIFNRLILSATVVLIKDKIFQIIVLFVSQLITLAIVAHGCPYEDRTLWGKELCN